jgi:hypothetical protein
MFSQKYQIYLSQKRILFIGRHKMETASETNRRFAFQLPGNLISLWPTYMADKPETHKKDSWQWICRDLEGNISGGSF